MKMRPTVDQGNAKVVWPNMLTFEPSSFLGYPLSGRESSSSHVAPPHVMASIAIFRAHELLSLLLTQLIPGLPM
jgi:hypothetical protein